MRDRRPATPAVRALTHRRGRPPGVAARLSADGAAPIYLSANMPGAIALAVDPPDWTAAKTRALEAALPELLYPTG